MPRLLIADDEQGARDILADAVRSFGMEADTVSSAEEALTRLDEGHKYDLILTDLKMKGMNGIELVREAKARDDTVEVIVVTGYPTIDTAVEAVRAGAYDYIIKPFKLAEARLAINRALEKRALNNEARFFKGLFWAALLSLPFWVVGALVIYILTH